MSWVVDMGAWDVCEAVGNVAVAHRSIVPCRCPRGHFWDRGANFGLEGFATALMRGQRLMARPIPGCALRMMGGLGLGLGLGLGPCASAVFSVAPVAVDATFVVVRFVICCRFALCIWTEDR